MESVSRPLGKSTEEQGALRAVALWAADCAEEALLLFESHHREDDSPRRALEAAREYGKGKKRDKGLRVVAMAALRAGKATDEASKYAARAAMLAASVAYTHTDLQDGLQGVRQARHVLGPAVYAALALETAAGGDPHVGNDFIMRAIATAPGEVRYILRQLPAQPEENGRLAALFFELDLGLRG